MERTNPTDHPASSFSPASSTNANERERERKKQTGNVRRVLTSRKSLREWIGEIVRSFITLIYEC